MVKYFLIAFIGSCTLGFFYLTAFCDEDNKLEELRVSLIPIVIIASIILFEM